MRPLVVLGLAVVAGSALVRSWPRPSKSCARNDSDAFLAAPSQSRDADDRDPIRAEPAHAGDSSGVHVADAVAQPDVVVRAVDAVTGRRISGARVVGDPPAHIDIRTDSNGMASILLPRGPGPFRVAAQRGSLYGETWVDPALPTPRHGWRIGLEPDKTVQIQVVDSFGAPVADVPIALVFASESPRRRLRVGRTDRTGSLTVPHLQRLAGTRNPPHPTNVVAVLDCPGAPTGLDFDPRHPPQRPLRLTMPPYGRIVAQVRDDRGPRRLAASFSLREIAGDATGGATWHTSAVDGVATFLRVPLGRRFELRVDLPNARPEVVVGPRRIAETVMAEATLARSICEITATLIDESGERLRNRRLSAWIERTQRCSFLPAHGNRRTDGEGRVRLLFEEPTIAAARELRIEVLDSLRRKTGLAAVCPLPSSLGPTTGLGTIQTDARPVLAAGRIFEDGRPFCGRLDFVVEHSAGADASDPAWQPVEDAVVRFEPGGSFVVRAKAVAGRLRLCTRSGLHLAEPPIECAAGDRGVTVRVTRGGSMRARLVLGRSVTATDLIVELLSEQQTAHRGHAGARERGTGAVVFEWHGLERGRYTLRVRTNLDRQPAIVLPNLRIERGSDCRDPRLRSIDTRASVRAIEIAFRDRRGRPAPRGMLLVRGDDAAGAPLGLPISGGGTAKVVTTRARVDGNAFVRGFEPAGIAGIGTRRVVTLDRPSVFALAWREGLPRLPDGVELRVRLRAADAGVRFRSVSGGVCRIRACRPGVARFGADGRTTIRGAVAGVYVVSVLVRRGSREVAVRGVSPGRVRVGRGAVPEDVVAVGAPRGAVERAIGKLLGGDLSEH